MEQAMTPEEWDRLPDREEWRAVRMDAAGYSAAEMDDAIAHDIAIQNAMLSDDDPRKFTWAKLDELRRCIASTGHADESEATQLADAIASYLPPRDSQTPAA